ncbi:MAG: methionyl-tRNA formyltransferase [Calditrichaeota bacterium]|nr:MAG: methionyl-tRNA formyltransferase [Calditrichota bacterium]
MKIVFMGTPAFAVPSLSTLHESRHQIVAVVTQPDRAAGRGLKLRASPVKLAAEQLGLPVLQPESLAAPDFVQRLQGLDADLFAVVAFRILPESIFTIPPKGTVNLHASLLPKYRGAAPINWAIINGETRTGVTTILIRKEVDAGDILLQRETEIGEDETAGELHDRLAQLGAEVLLETVEGLDAGTLTPKRQEGEVTRAPKLTRELAEIRWHQSSVEIRNLVRGLNPVPAAFTYFHGKVLKVFEARLADPASDAEPGEIIEVSRHSFKVATGSGALEVTQLQLEGKRKMSVEEFLRGQKVHVGQKLGR